jgi:hypothetical protein
VPDRSAVKLGDQELQAFRYAGLQPEGLDGTLTLYAAPTSAGIATIACVAPAGAGEGFQAECDGIANTLALEEGEKGLLVGPDPAYAKTVSGALAGLDRAVSDGRRDLGARGAKANRQANAAQRIQRAYSRAAGDLRTSSLRSFDRELNAALRDRLRAASQAWGGAASAARREDARAFDRAEARIRRAERAVRTAVARLGDAGYTVRS